MHWTQKAFSHFRLDNVHTRVCAFTGKSVGIAYITHDIRILNLISRVCSAVACLVLLVSGAADKCREWSASNDYCPVGRKHLLISSSTMLFLWIPLLKSCIFQNKISPWWIVNAIDALKLRSNMLKSPLTNSLWHHGNKRDQFTRASINVETDRNVSIADDF